MKQYLDSRDPGRGARARGFGGGQDPPPAQTPPPATTARDSPTPTAAVPVTVEGCLMREPDVPGRKANVAEKVGIGEDFILTSTKMVKGMAPGACPLRPVARLEPAGRPPRCTTSRASTTGR